MNTRCQETLVRKCESALEAVSSNAVKAYSWFGKKLGL